MFPVSNTEVQSWLDGQRFKWTSGGTEDRWVDGKTAPQICGQIEEQGHSTQSAASWCSCLLSSHEDLDELNVCWANLAEKLTIDGVWKMEM